MYKIIFSLLLSLGFFLTACTSGTKVSYNSYIYNGINFGADRDVSFKKGVQDGCRTASGNYVKNHEAFNNNRSYRDGWGDGRLQCYGK